MASLGTCKVEGITEMHTNKAPSDPEKTLSAGTQVRSHRNIVS